MKLAIIFLLSCLVISTFAAKTTADKLKEISKVEFGRTLLKTIQIELKDSTKADPRPRIISLLHEIEDEARSTIGSLSERHTAKQEACEVEVENLEEQIESYDQQISDANNQISSAEDTLATLEADLANQEAVLEAAEESLEEITEKRNESQEAFEAADDAMAQIIDVLEQTRKYITDRLEARQSEYDQDGDDSFLEKQNVLIQVKETVMNEHFQKISPGWSKVISFLATKALNMLKQDDADVVAVAGLQSIVDLINQLVADKISLRNAAQSVNNDEIDVYNQKSELFNNLISAASGNIAQDKTQIAFIKQNIAQLQASVTSAAEILSNKKDTLFSTEQDCEAEAADFLKAVAARQAELDLILQVLEIMNNDLTNLRQTIEDTIVNSDIVVDS